MSTLNNPLETWLRRLAPWLAAAAIATTPAFAGDDDDDDDDDDGGGRFPRVSVHAIDGKAVEPNRDDTLVFEFRRTGETTAALPVFFRATGKAEFGVDFEPLDPASVTPLRRDGRGRPIDWSTHRIVIPAGEAAVRLVLAPIADDTVEHDERFVIHVRNSTIWKNDGVPDQSYRPGEPESASGVILEAPPTPPANPPTITIAATRPETTEPTPEVRVRPGVLTLTRTGPALRPLKVHYDVEGSAQNGVDYRELDGDTTFGVGQLTKQIRVEALMDTVAERDEEVIVRIRPDAAYVVGDPAAGTVVIHNSVVLAPASLVFTAPAPGAEFAEPATINLALTAVDPAGYIDRVEFFSGDTSIGVSQINFIQAPDPGTPVAHQLEWKDVVAGNYSITARATDTHGNPVTSSALALVVKPVTPPPPPPVVRHPADVNPADNVLTGDEVAVYAEAWRTGAAPSVGPTPVPIGYLTRAGYLWKAGEGYIFQAVPGDLPLAFVSTNPDAGNPPVGPVSFAIAEVPLIEGAGAYTLSVRSGPADNIRSHAIQIQLAPGSTATAISDDGTFDLATSTLRWGPFHDDVDRVLTANIVSPAVSDVSGVASFDGSDSPVAKVPPPPLPPGGEVAEPRIAALEPLKGGDVRLIVIEDGAGEGTETEIEVSTDLLQWMGISRGRGHRGASAVVDSDANEDTVRFYRAVRRRP